jgi:predicted DNA-binding transcriptional regulator AlpA
VTAAAEALLLTREDAAALLGVSLRSFDRHVSREVPRVQIGSRVLYDRKDLEGWLARRKVGPSTKIPALGSTPSATGSRVVVITDRRAREIAEKLRSALPASTKRR